MAAPGHAPVFGFRRGSLIEGNRIRRTELATGAVTDYTWDHRNRLTEVADTQHTYFDFNNVTLLSYGGTGPGGQDQTPTQNDVLDDGRTLHLWGNTHKGISPNYDVTADTLLQFDFNSDIEGEEHSIGVDSDLGFPSSVRFKLFGTDSSAANEDFDTYNLGDGWVRFTIPIGQYVSAGTQNYLTLHNDHDVGTPTAESFYRDVRLFEQAASMDLTGVTLLSFGGGTQDQTPDNNDVDGTQLHLWGNTHKGIQVDYDMTASTVLEFSFFSSDEGEEHAIGIDNDLNFPSPVRFHVLGTDITGANFDYDTYQVGDGWVRYRISIGEYVSAGTYIYLTIHHDDDQYASSNSYYRDIRLFEGATTQRVTHSYDAFNQWITRTVDTDGDGGSDPIERTAFVHDAGQIVLQFDDTGTAALDAADLSHRYLWGPAVDQLVADEAVDSVSSAGETLWPLSDHLGTIRDIVDDNATLRKHTEYDSFGQIKNETYYDESGTLINNPDTHAEAIDQLFAYTGRPLDESTNLQNNLHRWYDAAIGQWASEDPIGFAAVDPNLRRYVGNSANGSTDPTGLFNLWNPITWGISDPYQSGWDAINPFAPSAKYWDTIKGGAEGTVTSTKLAVNNTVKITVSTATLGFCEADDMWTVNKFDRAYGYEEGSFFFRVGGEILVGVATGGVSQAGKVGKGIALFDTAGNFVGVAQGSIDMLDNGINTGNALQVIGGGAGLGGNFVGAVSAPGGTRQLRLPQTNPNLAGTSTLGETLPDGRVFLRPGLSRYAQVHTMRHESVHAFFSPRGSGPITRCRQNVGQFAYDNSQLLRFTEEAIAEGFANRSIIRGLRHPFVTDQFGNRLYGISAGGLIGESVVGGTIVVGGAYGANQIGQQLFGNGP